ncbi:ATP-binding cassette domain-containing protein [Parapedobacter sp. ISTM3]|uniref:Putative ABC transport system ATP-binding protein n=1 Tax=Parapedobacter luteus TaxID=623280 RepID=A0A1T5F0U7_9SPHI|nr:MULTISPECIES: ATP-binding cassette domain-containing protein [Parapedobacter]MBK1439275.1 ATP-binding cassette domain-containing protein [Parapedobacter sp. ISTM3]SKB89783.1 putative ABC transport system ATP-binding protein [Parapedobacter luteus]
MLQLQRITKVFNPGKATEVIAVQDTTLRLEAGSFTVLVGANGSGKSTLLNLIAGSIYADRGKVLLNDREIQRLPDYRRSQWIARVFQNPLTGTASSLSILDNFRMAALRRVPKWLKLGADAAFKRSVAEKVETLGMGLEHKLAQPMGTLSGGQRQALTLLMTTMADVDILLLDEPTAALDPRSAREVMGIADRIVRENNLTALLVTHNIAEALRYGTRLIQMENGKIIRDCDQQAKLALKQTDVVSWFDYY